MSGFSQISTFDLKSQILPKAKISIVLDSIFPLGGFDRVTDTGRGVNIDKKTMFIRLYVNRFNMDFVLTVRITTRYDSARKPCQLYDIMLLSVMVIPLNIVLWMRLKKRLSGATLGQHQVLNKL